MHTIEAECAKRLCATRLGEIMGCMNVTVMLLCVLNVSAVVAS